MALVPRSYQLEAKEAIYRHMETREDNPCAVIPTAGGKSLVLAMICSDVVNLWQGRVLVLAHVKELLEQNAGEIVAADPALEGKVGIYSAGLGEKDPHKPIVVAGIQSAYKHPRLFNPDLVIVDEAHLIPPDGEGMYRTMLSTMKTRNPKLRVIGLTATPYRMSTGTICAPGNILNHVCYEAGVLDLIKQGFLCRLTSRQGLAADMEDVHIRGGEFVADEAEARMMQMVDRACSNLTTLAADRKSILVFCAGVDHAMAVADRLRESGPTALILGGTPAEERAGAIEDFKNGLARYLVNVNVLTTGFNAPNIDAIAVLRPTMSPGLWYQMCGRGFRLFPNKINCLILDYGGNAIRHGPVDCIESVEQRMARGRGEAPWKACPSCGAVAAAAARKCEECGYLWPPIEKKHETVAGDTPVLSGEVKFEEFEVKGIDYRVHENRKGRTLLVVYEVGNLREIEEWVCLEHPPGSFPWQEACLWWARRSNAPVPNNIEDAVKLAERGLVARARKITVKSVSGEKYPRVTSWALDTRPAHEDWRYHHEGNSFFREISVTKDWFAKNE